MSTPPLSSTPSAQPPPPLTLLSPGMELLLLLLLLPLTWRHSTRPLLLHSSASSSLWCGWFLLPSDYGQASATLRSASASPSRPPSQRPGHPHAGAIHPSAPSHCAPLGRM